MLDTSAVILTNETSQVFSKDKATMILGNKALIRHVFDAVNPIVDEVILVTNTQEASDTYAKLLPKTVKFAIDNQQSTQSLLSGTIAGFEIAQGKYALLLPYDVPFFSREIAEFLLNLTIDKMAAVPRTPNNNVEPLCSAYQTKAVLEIAKQAILEDITIDLHLLIEKLRGVRYISMSVIEQIDPEMKSLFYINTPVDFKRATIMLQGKQKHQNRQKR
ncbi:MAG: NTP transferase domain-containing protein [Candidatus Bathyarchaeota archaeon]|uniref:molybdenum cofactor guanylyltransferase n=1 Tax=Candidatus Bathycorpusculum sp. TaxID=2994959 RepID=UPI002831823D|nr:NTP transferase domain-containing protein [Candidatus Termiticorpusculum sp.]MCL2292119.1 NTP transferase domain-containing protein [Candidatus Termiticorpusculum sp.]